MDTFRKTRQRRELPFQGRYLTFSCYHRLPLFGNDAIKDAFVERLVRTKKTHPFWLLAWVVMPTHVHLLVVPELPATPVPSLLIALKRPFAADVLDRWRALSAPILNRVADSEGHQHFWQQGGGHDRNILAGNELPEKINYMHNNPVAAKLVERPTGWKWSSASAYAGAPYFGPPIDEVHEVGKRPPRRG